MATDLSFWKMSLAAVTRCWLLGASCCPSVLRLKIARLAAIDAVVLPVLAQADIMLSMAQVAVLVALAAGLFFVADYADEFFSHFATL